MPPIDASYTAPSELIRNQYGTANKQLGGGPMSVMVAAGPYTVDSNLEYAPLDALLKAAQREKPDLLILVSPSLVLLPLFNFTNKGSSSSNF